MAHDRSTALYVEIVSMFQTDFIATGIALFGDLIIVLAFNYAESDVDFSQNIVYIDDGNIDHHIAVIMALSMATVCRNQIYQNFECLTNLDSNFQLTVYLFPDTIFIKQMIIPFVQYFIHI